MAQLALNLTAATPPMTIIERHRVTSRFQTWLAECKVLQADGWDVTVLLEEPKRTTAVLLAWRAG